MSHGKVQDQGVKAKAVEEKGMEEVSLKVEEGHGQGGKVAGRGPELLPEHRGRQCTGALREESY